MQQLTIIVMSYFLPSFLSRLTPVVPFAAQYYISPSLVFWHPFFSLSFLAGHREGLECWPGMKSMWPGDTAHSQEPVSLEAEPPLPSSEC